MCVKSHIYPRIASQRRKLGFSQQELALRAGLRREKINRVESRGEDIGFDDLCRLVEALGLEFDLREVDSSGAGGSPPRLSASAIRHRLKPKGSKEIALLDASKARIISWGKVPK
jgi:transcriptional regulator with XRE-family HTH domain